MPSLGFKRVLINVKLVYIYDDNANYSEAKGQVPSPPWRVTGFVCIDISNERGQSFLSIAISC